MGKIIRSLLAVFLFAHTLGCLEEPDVEERSNAVSCTLSEEDYWISVQKTDIFISAVHTGAEIDEFRLNSDPDALFCVQYTSIDAELVIGFCNRNDGQITKKGCDLPDAIAKCKDLSNNKRRYFIDSPNNLEAHQTECEADHDIWTEF